MENIEKISRFGHKVLSGERIEKLIEKYKDYDMREEGEYLVFNCGDKITKIHKWANIPVETTNEKSGEKRTQMVAMEDHLSEQLGF